MLSNAKVHENWERPNASSRCQFAMHLIEIVCKKCKEARATARSLCPIGSRTKRARSRLSRRLKPTNGFRGSVSGGILQPALYGPSAGAEAPL